MYQSSELTLSLPPPAAEVKVQTVSDSHHVARDTDVHGDILVVSPASSLAQLQSSALVFPRLG